MDDQKEPEGGPRELQQDALVEKLVDDPSQLPNVRALIGLLGRSTEAGRLRLYLTHDFSEYVEFSEKDVVHTQPLATSQSPIGGTIVWLNRDATLQHTQTISQRTQAEFLTGDIASGFMSQAAMRGISGTSTPRQAVCYFFSLWPITPNCRPPSLGCFGDL